MGQAMHKAQGMQKDAAPALRSYKDVESGVNGTQGG